MTAKRLAAVVLVLVAVVVWWRSGGASDTHEDAHDGKTPIRSVDTTGLKRQLQRGGRTGAVEWRSEAREEGVSISGQVVDVLAGKGVAGIEVVFRNGDGAEESTTTASDGTYKIQVATGVYHAFVRDDDVLSIGTSDFVRLPGLPDAGSANTPDEALMPTVVASTDVQHLDLSVMHAGMVSGRVIDRNGKPIADAVVRAHGADGRRPALGTDVAESDEHGAFEMRLPPGHYILEASHAQLAGAIGDVTVDIDAGLKISKDLTMTAGCVIAGKVVGPDGKPTGDGALERRYGTGDNQFAPAGRVDSNGNFRWVIAQPGDVSLRAWPWKSPPSPEQQFACTDGARFANVVFYIPQKGPDIDGTLVDASGTAVPFAFVDIAPLDEGGFGQQERADGQGHWSVYNMVPGRYRVTATSPNRGVVTAEITAPVSNVALALSGTGRVDGTTTDLADGSFELRLDNCDNVNLAHQPRLVAVHDHHFTVDDLPACSLNVTASWHGEDLEVTLPITAGGVAHTELAIGPPRVKHIHGIVRDEQGTPVRGAQVVANYSDRGTTNTETDERGMYALDTVAGASVMAMTQDHAGDAIVSRDGPDDAELDIVIAEQREE